MILKDTSFFIDLQQEIGPETTHQTKGLNHESSYK